MGRCNNALLMGVDDLQASLQAQLVTDDFIGRLSVSCKCCLM